MKPITKEYVEHELAQYKFPGMGIGVIKDGEVLQAEGFGFADLEKKTLIDKDTEWGIASCSKAFTATLAHQMEAEDTVSAALRFEGGALGGVYATTASFPGRGKRIEITGTKGTIVVEDPQHGSSNAGAIPTEQHRKCIAAFMESVRGGTPYPIDGHEARKPVDLIERIYLDAASQARPFLVK